MVRNIVLVGIGGFLGSASRYLVSLVLTRLWTLAFPLGTFMVNVLGCFLIGLIYGLSGRVDWMNPEWRVFAATGFCGGFTTFSSFTFENADLLQTGQYWTFAFYTIASFAIGLLAVFAGIVITKL